jgi:phosphatidylglycerol:prolipoprotein diacylglycerol transferase
MHPILFEFGGLRIGTFGVMMVTGFIVSWLLFRSEMKRKKLKVIDTDLLLAAMIGGIAGAKVYYLIEHWSLFAADPFGSIG